MKKSSYVLFAVALSLFAISACKEKTDQELLNGDWNVTYALDSDGDQAVGEDEDYVYEMVISFSESNVTFLSTEIEKDTGDRYEEIFYGSYHWNNNSIEMTLFDFGDSITMVSTALNFPDEDHLNLSLDATAWSDTSMIQLDLRAERR